MEPTSGDRREHGRMTRDTESRCGGTPATRHPAADTESRVRARDAGPASRRRRGTWPCVSPSLTPSGAVTPGPSPGAQGALTTVDAAERKLDKSSALGPPYAAAAGRASRDRWNPRASEPLLRSSAAPKGPLPAFQGGPRGSSEVPGRSGRRKLDKSSAPAPGRGLDKSSALTPPPYHLQGPRGAAVPRTVATA